ncbi:MAG: acyltransferase family protein [Candidatus Saccharibacteria bacterium]|nr:acyltransferase family protein [Candidatus Saccharibacteria bacterium]
MNIRDLKKKPRLAWVDCAKGVAIICVIIGHTAFDTSDTFSFITSFHMPLFFLLSGFTMHPTTDKKTFLKKTLRDAKTLLLPTIIFSFVRIVVGGIQKTGFSSSIILSLLLKWFNSLLSSTSNPYISLGMLWFLVSMFVSRLFINATTVAVGPKNNKYPLLFLGAFGVFLGANSFYLPFNIDISLVCVLFITLGLIARSKLRFLKKHRTELFIVACGIWLYGIMNTHFIALAEYGMSKNLFAIIVALSGSYCVSVLCKTIHKLRFSKFFEFFGKYSLIVLIVHYLDQSILFKHWTSIEPKPYWVRPAIFRVIIVLCISATFMLVKAKAKTLISRPRHK